MAEPRIEQKHLVAVTGANGFIASWLVKFLLQRGYFVRGTVRDPDNEAKMAHIRNLEGAKERLELVKADILDYASVLKAVDGCQGVFHTACPVKVVTDDRAHTELIKPAVEGTINVLDACARAKVKRVVMTSTFGAAYIDPKRPSSQILDESCWSDLEHLLDIKEWYCLAKTMAERAAWDYAASTPEMDLVTICPSVTLGTLMQADVNVSCLHILKYLTGSAQTYANLCQAYVNVKDAAEAHILAYEAPDAYGRYLCVESSLHRGDVVETLATMYPQYPITTKCKDEKKPRKVPHTISTKKLQDLGLQFTPFKQTLAETVTSFQEKGFLQPRACL